MSFYIKYILIGLSHTLLLNYSLFAEEQDGVVEGRDTKGLSIDLVSEVKSVQPGKPFRVGISIVHDKGFHSYWQNPGVVGMATQIKWDLPEGFKASQIHWPYPELSKMADYPCFGYERDTLLYVIVTPPEEIKAKSLKFVASANWMCCSSTCHPGFKKFTLSLPVGEGEIDQKMSELFKRAECELPVTSEKMKAELISTGDDKKIAVRIISKEKVEYVFNSDGQTTPDLSSSLKKISDDTWQYEAQRSEYGPKEVDKFPLVIKTTGGYVELIAK